MIRYLLHSVSGPGAGLTALLLFLQGFHMHVKIRRVGAFLIDLGLHLVNRLWGLRLVLSDLRFTWATAVNAI